jgi:hypothetical protein
MPQIGSSRDRPDDMMMQARIPAPGDKLIALAAYVVLR